MLDPRSLRSPLRSSRPPGAPLPLAGKGLRILWFTAGAVVLSLTVVAVIWILAYGLSPEPASRLRLPPLEADASAGWYDDGAVRIDAATPLDAAAALGYAHARQHVWTITLWRQTAMGTLTSWFGPELLDLDRFARQMRFDALAEHTFRSLPPGDQAYLRSYARGINAALNETALFTQDEFALLQIRPERWRPWHTLAVERLFAWLSVRLDQHLPPFETRPASLQHFADTDRRLREWLQLHSFDNSFAWVSADSASVLLGQRLVTGSSPHPAFQVAVVRTPAAAYSAVTIPGTPIATAGRSAHGAWAVLLGGTASVRYAPDSLSHARPLVYERIEGRHGQEFLHSFRTGDGFLQFDTLQDTLHDPVHDSLLTLFWPGLTPGTDLTAWRGLLRGEASAFHLVDGAGILLAPSGDWQVLGSPRYREESGGVTLVARTPWAPYLARHLSRLARNGDQAPRPGAWTDDCVSEWAADVAPGFVAAIAAQEGLDAIDRDALTYLRNWDFSYARSSIGASIFEAWTDALRGPRRLTPDLFAETPPTDTLLAGFRRAVAGLADTLGTDLSTWRLENVRPIAFFYPAWTSTEALAPDQRDLAATRYAPLRLPGRGHPSALCWGSFDTVDGFQASSKWDVWSYAGANDTLYTRHRALETSGFLGRYRIPIQLPAPSAHHPGLDAPNTTRLVPPPSR